MSRASLLDELNVGSLGHVTHLGGSSSVTVQAPSSSSADSKMLKSEQEMKPNTSTTATSSKNATAGSAPAKYSASEESECLTVMFYFDWCPFSQAAAPAYNALPRAFPSLNVWALDTHSKNR